MSTDTYAGAICPDHPRERGLRHCSTFRCVVCTREEAQDARREQLREDRLVELSGLVPDLLVKGENDDALIVSIELAETVAG